MDVKPLITVIAIRAAQAAALSAIVQRALGWPFRGRLWRLNGAITTLLLAADICFVFIPFWRWGLPIVTDLAESGEPEIALTFDDGPDPEITPQILDILAAENVRATFFMLQDRAEANPDLVRRVVAEGHTVAVHGRTHEQLATRSARYVERELRTAAEAFAAMTSSSSPTLYRPPYGFKSLALLVAARRCRMRVVLWSIDSLDYLYRTPEAIAGRVCKRIRPRAIVLMHDGPGRHASIPALRMILPEIKRRGLLCVCVPDR